MSILERFKKEYEKDLEAIRNGEKGPSPKDDKIEAMGRELANKFWEQNITDSGFDIPIYSTDKLREIGKINIEPIPNIVLVRAYCPKCGEEINHQGYRARHKCPKCGEEFKVDAKYPHLAVKVADNKTIAIDLDMFTNSKPLHEEDRDEEIPSFDEVPECPNWEDNDDLTPSIFNEEPEAVNDVDFVDGMLVLKNPKKNG